MKEMLERLKAQLRIMKADYIQDLRDYTNSPAKLREVNVYYEDKIMDLEAQISFYESHAKVSA